jgi:hypothetical protein
MYRQVWSSLSLVHRASYTVPRARYTLPRTPCLVPRLSAQGALSAPLLLSEYPQVSLARSAEEQVEPRIAIVASRSSVPGTLCRRCSMAGCIPVLIGIGTPPPYQSECPFRPKQRWGTHVAPGISGTGHRIR